ncbi:MAG: hypothetical protein CXZ00_08920 [Acidobacteria bacterium]|nr:MAG: hypothetical protein CXZ00_08920 [Acidobacteriota bacterium]
MCQNLSDLAHAGEQGCPQQAAQHPHSVLQLLPPLAIQLSVMVIPAKNNAPPPIQTFVPILIVAAFAPRKQGVTVVWVVDCKNLDSRPDLSTVADINRHNIQQYTISSLGTPHHQDGWRSIDAFPLIYLLLRGSHVDQRKAFALSKMHASDSVKNGIAILISSVVTLNNF